MALMKCPECSGQVSDQALACPHCGYAGKRKAKKAFTVDEGFARSAYREQEKRLQKKRLGFVVVLFAAIMVIGLFAETDEGDPANSAKAVVQHESEPAAESSLLASATDPQDQSVRNEDAGKEAEEDIQVSSESIPMSFEECQAAKGSVIAKLNVSPKDIVPIINTSLVTITRIFTDDGSVLITCTSADNKMVITKSSVGRES